MPTSPYVRGLREYVGHDLLLLPAVTAVIQKGDRFLLCKQPNSPEWGLIGGGIEPGEDPLEAVLREVEEEIGVRADVRPLPERHGTPPKPATEKAVCYVIAENRLLVFTHDDVDIRVTGVQVPAGTVRDGETPTQAAERELFEETGLRGSVTRSLGTELYDLSPARDEVVRRHFFVLEVADPDVTCVWQAGEPDPAIGGHPVTWTCRWIPLSQAHVLAAGLSSRLGAASR